MGLGFVAPDQPLLGTGLGGSRILPVEIAPPWPIPKAPEARGVELAQRPVRYSIHNWDAVPRSLALVAEFLSSGAVQRLKVANFPGPKETLEELALLYQRAQLRAERRDEILAQAFDPYSAFFQLLMANPDSQPRTYEVMSVASNIARLVGMHFKLTHARPRPSQLDPYLYPMIPAPGHASYPSGHATQARLIALALRAVQPQLGPELIRVAERIAENREVAGLHYASDSAAGNNLADQVYAELSKLESFRSLIEMAKAEWS